MRSYRSFGESLDQNSRPGARRQARFMDEILSRDIIAAVDAGFDDQVKLTADVTALPSLRGQEATAQDFMAEQYRRRGLGVDRWKIKVEDIQDLPGFSPVAVSYDNAFN